MTSLVLVGACAFCHELMATAAVAMTTAANTAYVDPVTNVGFSISQIDTINRPNSGMARRDVVRPLRVVIKAPFKDRNELASRRQTDDECGEVL
jgi:hypothetical protein